MELLNKADNKLLETKNIGDSLIISWNSWDNSPNEILMIVSLYSRIAHICDYDKKRKMVVLVLYVGYDSNNDLFKDVLSFIRFRMPTKLCRSSSSMWGCLGCMNCVGVQKYDYNLRRFTWQIPEHNILGFSTIWYKFK